jgi:hypothetical protein
MTRVDASLGRIALEWTPLTVTQESLAIETSGRVVAESPINVQAISWLARRYTETGNGTYAIEGIRAALAARGRIDEPWLCAYLADCTGSVMSGALGSKRRKPTDRGDALVKIMLLNNGRGKDPVEEAIIDIRDHNLYFRYLEELLANGNRKKDAEHKVATEYELSDNFARNIIARIKSECACEIED